MSAQATETTHAIELIVEQDEKGQVAATVPVRWKISPEMAHNLAEKGVEPFMLLVVTQGKSELNRYVVPLKEGMTYLQMRRPGTLTLHATIVWQGKEEPWPAKKVVMAKDDYGNYNLELVGCYIPGLTKINQQVNELHYYICSNSDSSDEDEIDKARNELNRLREECTKLNQQEPVFGLIDAFEAIERTPEGDQLNIEVPEAMFAKEPPRWMSWLATRYKWPKKAQDECDLRRRALLTVFSAPFVIPVGLVFGAIAVCGLLMFKLTAVIVTAVLLFFGKRNLDYSVIYEWDNIELRDIWRYSKPSVWYYKKVKTEQSYYEGGPKHTEIKYEKRNPAFEWINPPTLAFFIVLQLLFRGVELSSVLAGILFPVIFGLGAFFIDRRRKLDNKKDKKVVTDEQRSKLQQKLSTLTTGGAARISDLPPEQRTVKLRYLDLKAAVCKPFAR